MKAALWLPVILLLAGCGLRGERPTLSITSYATDGSSAKKKFVVVRGPNVTNPVEYEQAANSLIYAMTSRGYQIATPATADLVVFLDYKRGVNTEQYTVHAPVYGSVPGPVSTVNVVTTPIGSRNGPTMTTGTITNYPTTDVVGYETQTRSATFTGIMAHIEGYDSASVTNGSGAKTGPLWRVDAVYMVRGPMADGNELLTLVEASAPYAGVNSGGTIRLNP